MRAGASQVDITPLADVHHTLEKNFLSQQHWRVAIDPLHAGALVLENDGRKIWVITVELNSIDDRCRDEIRQAVADRCGIDPPSYNVPRTPEPLLPAARLRKEDHRILS